ncbi:hypothetical protein G7Z17_g12659 [Cylindrodendrum hubeiense]|uniref:Aminoglycoside phosphotransferase domain-containing protein n=1 Tax=Cylindrodendrum hubeiense TaxID=595255 RepID=A0A9P5H1I6_9HYPO|nr:hypothetical protein G7Z17_g12659 [Cylindrodendrum hubeiense]
MANDILRDKAEKEGQHFIESINTDTICRLASFYHAGVPCKTFGSPKHGSFNVCIFVEFETSPPERWAVRIPLPALTVWIDEKIEAELATMRYVSAKTTIPVPRVHAYSFTEGSPIKTAFIVMDYVQGQTLHELGFPFPTQQQWCSYASQTRATNKLHKQLADIYIQLRQLEFPEIGALGLPIVDGKPSYECNPDDIRVCHRPMSMEMALQEVQGMDPGAYIKPNTTFSTARSFVDALLFVAENDLEKSPDMGLDNRGGREALYARHHFRRFVLDTWLESTADQGPFVLMHGELDMLMSSLLFDEELNLVSVLDWEWSCVIPAQMMVAPIWLTGCTPESTIIYKGLFYKEVSSLVDAIKDREQALGVPPTLSQEWAKMETWCHTAVVMALVRPDRTYDVYWYFLFGEIEEEISPGYTYSELHSRFIAPRLEVFMESPGRKALLARKEEEQRRFFEAEKRHFNYRWARQIMR